MSKNILIVENDAALSRAMKDKLTARGFGVEETNDGKGCAELIRRTKPGLVVLAVDLAAGQNGYIICKKLKSDDELKGVPVLIIGNPDGFAQHKKLKTHADDYLGKPFDATAVVDRAGALIGFPEPPAQEVVEEDGISLNDLLSDDQQQPAVSEEIAVDTEAVHSGDADLDMVDAMFDDKGSAQPAPVEEELKSEEFQLEEDDELADRTVVGFSPPVPPPSSAPTQPSVKTQQFATAAAGGADPAALSRLRGQVNEANSAAAAAKQQAEEFEQRIRQLETELEGKSTEIETLRSTSAKTDSKEVFNLKDAATKKDKEILRLKNELNGKDNEIVELQEKLNGVEQQASEATGEIARRDAQIKTLTTKTDQLAAERKKFDQQLMQAREEARVAAAKHTTAQTELEALMSRVPTLEGELEALRTSHSEAESARQQVENELAEARGEIEATKSQLDERTREADEARSQYEQAQIDLESAKSQLASQAASFEEEGGSLRKRVQELEEAASRSDEKLGRLNTRLKGEEQLRAKTREALALASQLLDEPTSGEDVDISDELAEA